ncbi:hypothetical protein MKW98_031042, partial [Papaver atlanticum]
MKLLNLWALILGFASLVEFSKNWVLVEAGFEGFKFAQEEAIFHVDGRPSTSDLSDPKMVDLTLIQGATDKGAVCLDGTVPGYHLDRGFGSGANSWLIQLEANQLYFRGQRIWLAGMEDLMSKGMSNANQGVEKNLPHKCADPTSVRASLAPSSADPQGLWRQCKSNIANCSDSQIQFLQGFRHQMLNAVDHQFSRKKKNGVFINSCYAHCQTERQDTWFADDSPLIKNR